MPNKMDKQHFTYYINKLKELSETEENLNAISSLINFSISFGVYEELIIGILEDVFDDGGNQITLFGKAVLQRGAGVIIPVKGKSHWKKKSNNTKEKKNDIQR